MREPRTYVYLQHQAWGDRLDILDWTAGTIVGWMTPMPKVGDAIAFAMQSGDTVTRMIERIEPCRDPRDMFYATLGVSHG